MRRRRNSFTVTAENSLESVFVPIEAETKKMKSKKIINRWVLSALLLTGFAFASPAQTRRASKTFEKPLPNLILNSIDGQEWSLYENRGRIVLLNFWATWCAPCRAEVPYLVRLSSKYKASGLEVVGIAVDSANTRKIADFIKEFKVDYPILLTVPGSVLSQQKAVPMSLLIDEKGVLAKKYVGAIKESVFEKDIKNLLSKKSVEKKLSRNSKTGKLVQTS